MTINSRQTLIELREAIVDNNKAQLQLLIQRGADVNLEWEDGSTSLHLAAERDNAELARILLDAGANVHATNKDQETPFYLAVKTGEMDLVRLLLDAGADINTTNKFGITPVKATIKYERLETLRLLIAAGADIHGPKNFGETPSHLEAGPGEMEVEDLLDEDDAIHSARYSRFPPLHQAARTGKCIYAGVLLTAGADINSVDEDGNTAFYLAVAGGYVLFALHLLDAGTNIHATDKDGNTVLHRLARLRMSDIYSILIRSLVEADIDINAINKRGESPLHLALEFHRHIIAGVLFDAGVDINATVTKGSTPFHIAAENSHISFERQRQQGDSDLISCKALYLKHIVRLKCLGLHVSEENLSYLRKWFNEELRMFEKECKAEVASMKREEIREGYRFSLCEVLTKEEDVLKRVLQVEEAKLKLEKIVEQMRYPAYEDMIELKYWRVETALEYSVKARKIIGFIVNGEQSVPEECVDKIASYFTDRDMKDLSCTFK